MDNTSTLVYGEKISLVAYNNKSNNQIDRTLKTYPTKILLLLLTTYPIIKDPTLIIDPTILLVYSNNRSNLNFMSFWLIIKSVSEYIALHFLIHIYLFINFDELLENECVHIFILNLHTSTNSVLYSFFTPVTRRVFDFSL